MAYFTAGATGSSTATIDIPKAYAGKEGQIVFIVSGLNTYIGEAYTPSEKLYSYLGPKTTQSQINILSQSKSTYISSLEHGTYTFTAGYLYNGELTVSPLGLISSVYITVIDVDPTTPEPEEPPATEPEEKDTTCQCHCCCCCNCNNNSDDSLLLINSLYTCISNLQNTMNEEDTKIRASLIEYVNHLEESIANGNTQLKSYLTTQLQNLQNVHTLDIKELRTIIAQEIANLTSSINIINSKLSSLEKDFALTANNLQNAIANNSSNINTLKEQLQEKFNQLSQENNTLSKELFSLLEEKEAIYNDKIKELTLKHDQDIETIKSQYLDDKNLLEKNLKELNQSFQDSLAQLKLEHQNSLKAIENNLLQLDTKFTSLIEEYTKILRQEASNNNALLEDKIEELNNFLQSTLNTKLQQKLTLLEKEITNTQKKLNLLSSNTVLELNSQLAVLKENQSNEITQIENKYAILLKDSSLSETQKASLTSQQNSEISAIIVKYTKEENSIKQTLLELTSNDSSTLINNLEKLLSLKEKTISAISSTSLNDKISIITSIAEYLNLSNQNNINEKLFILQAQLDALTKLSNLSIEDVILQLQSSNLQNAANLEELKLVLSSYVDTVKKELSTQISGMTKLIEETEKALAKRISNLENRLRYFLLTEEELTKLVKENQDEISKISLLIAEKTSLINQLKENNQDTSSLEEELHLLTLQYEEAKEKENNLAIVVNLRENSELALHKKWIIQLQTLTSSLQKEVTNNQNTIAKQSEEIANLQASLTNLEKAFNLELKALEEKLNLAIEKKDAQTKAEIEELMNKIATLSDNVKSIASNPYFPSSSNNGFFNNRFGGSNSNIPVDDRDLRTDVNSNLLF
jgi:hypothetical protein